jgi:hypothetical protein
MSVIPHPKSSPTEPPEPEPLPEFAPDFAEEAEPKSSEFGTKKDAKAITARGFDRIV